jgi:hypothetical protein
MAAGEGEVDGIGVKGVMEFRVVELDNLEVVASRQFSGVGCLGGCQASTFDYITRLGILGLTPSRH